jgi:hypothetical protein
MYTKVFRQIYDGTLADNWQALVTFQQLLILADQDGVVDMTVGAIHRTTGIPAEIIAKGIEALEAPDHGSRTPDMEGRRIVRLDPHRGWGWFLVNFKKYRGLVSKEEKKEADRVRIAKRRAAEKSNVSNDVAECRGASPKVANVAHTEAYTEAEAVRAKASSLRSDSSSPAARTPAGLPGEPGALSLVPPAPATAVKATREARIAQIAADAQAAYNRTLGKPNGLLPMCAVINKPRRKAIEKALPTIGQICAQLYGDPRVTPEFWEAYFETAAEDDFHSGRKGGGPGHENWTPDFEFLLRETTIAKLFDRAMSEGAPAVEGKAA